MKKISGVLLASALLLFGCKQELPREVAAENIFGTVQKVATRDNVKQLIYTQGDDPYKKHWGLAAMYEVTIDDQVYHVNFDQMEKFKQIKVGDKLTLQPSQYIACTGESDMKPTCFRLMRVYKTETRTPMPTFK